MKESILKFLQYLSAIKHYSDHTIQAYRTDIEQFTHFIGRFIDPDSVTPQQITRDHLHLYLSSLIRHGMSKRTVARKQAALRSFFSFLIKTSVLKNNPTTGLVSPKLDKPLPEFFREDEIQKALCVVTKDTATGSRDRAILELFYGTGIRLSELVGLNLYDVDLSAGTVRVQGKGGKVRIVPVGRCVIKWMKAYIARRNELKPKEGKDAFFINKSGARISQRGVQFVVRKWLQLVSDKKKLSPHIIRHTFATHLLDKGADLEAVKELLGHSSLSTTQIYTHLTTDHLRRIYRQAHPRAESI